MGSPRGPKSEKRDIFISFLKFSDPKDQNPKKNSIHLCEILLPFISNKIFFTFLILGDFPKLRKCYFRKWNFDGLPNACKQKSHFQISILCWGLQAEIKLLKFGKIKISIINSVQYDLWYQTNISEQIMKHWIWK